MGHLVGRTSQRLQDFFKAIFAFINSLLNCSPARRDSSTTAKCSTDKAWPSHAALDDFSQEVERQLTGHLTPESILSMSKQIRVQLKNSAKTSTVSMLPSFHHVLPTGNEKGTYLALDMGGSTFRLALVELSGADGEIKVVRMSASPIDDEAKLLEGKAFFDWMAGKIGEMLQRGTEKYGNDSVPLPVGLSWSFPIEQTSVRSGRVIAMGKGFQCSNGTVGYDLADLIEEACQKQDINVRIDAIVNDGLATLLSRAYADPTTRMSLILGTGTNIAVHFPVHAIGIEKFGDRSADWFAQAKHVIVNTELSMFGGGGILPMTRWDDDLDRNHSRPGYQPLEYMATGRYLGEIARLVIVEAVESAGLFGGELPASMETRYSFETAISSYIEQDTSPLLQASSSFLQKYHDFTIPPTSTDLLFIQKVCKAISRRAAAYLASSIHGLWCLTNESESPLIPSTPKKELDSIDSLADTQVVCGTPVAIACDGTVINRYPNFRDRCQEYLGQLTRPATLASSPSSLPSPPPESDPKKMISSSDLPATATISLDPAPESAIFGAAVAVAVTSSDN